METPAVQFSIVNPLESKEWDDMVRLSPACSVFHSSNWSRVLSDIHGYTPYYALLLRDAETIGLMPMMEVKTFITKRRGVSLPFSDYCEPIVFDQSIVPRIVEEVSGHAKSHAWKYVEFREGQQFFEGKKHYTQYWGHTLGLEGNPEKLMSGFRATTRRNIRKAEKEGVTTETLTSLSAVKEFYRLYCITRKHQGLPPQPWAFFESIYKHLISVGCGFVALATFQREIVAGAFFLHFGHKAIYKYAAWKREYQHLRANNLVIWKAIQWYCENGYKSLSFGRTDMDNEGLRRFKKGWGGEEYTIKYYRYDVMKEEFVTGTDMRDMAKTYGGLFKRLPIPVLKVIGRLAYRHFG